MQQLGRRIILVIGAGLAVLLGFGCGQRSAPRPMEAPTVAADPVDNDEAAALAAAAPIDPRQIEYEQAATMATDLREVHALAVDAANRIYVGGDKAVCRYSPDGVLQARIALADPPKCVAVSGEARTEPTLYVGMESRIEVIRNATATAVKPEPWADFGEQASLTAVVVGDEDIYVADAGNRIVWKCDVNGKVVGRIGATDPARRIPGFQIINRYFDAAWGADGLLYVVNPRALRIEGYTPRGDLETHWGKGSPAVADFFGCCNPAHVAVLPNGRFVTAEKGLPRIKVYSREGRLEQIVAGPSQLTVVPADLATDHRGRILVLDSSSASVRIFIENSESAVAKP